MATLDSKTDEKLRRLVKEKETAPEGRHADGEDLAITLLKVAGIKAHKQAWEDGVNLLKDTIRGKKTPSPEQIRNALKQMGVCSKSEGGTYSDDFIVAFYKKIDEKIPRQDKDISRQDASTTAEVDVVSESDGDDVADTIINTILSDDYRKMWEEGRILLESILKGDTPTTTEHVQTALYKMGIRSFSSGGVFRDDFVRATQDEILRVATSCGEVRTKNVNNDVVATDEQITAEAIDYPQVKKTDSA